MFADAPSLLPFMHSSFMVGKWLSIFARLMMPVTMVNCHHLLCILLSFMCLPGGAGDTAPDLLPRSHAVVGIRSDHLLFILLSFMCLPGGAGDTAPDLLPRSHAVVGIRRVVWLVCQVYYTCCHDSIVMEDLLCRMACQAGCPYPHVLLPW